MAYFAETLLAFLGEQLVATGVDAVLREQTTAQGTSCQVLLVQEGAVSSANPKLRPVVSIYSARSVTARAEGDTDHIKLLCSTEIQPAPEYQRVALQVLNMLNRTLRYGCFYMLEDSKIYYEQDIAVQYSLHSADMVDGLLQSYQTYHILLYATYMPLLQCCNGYFTPKDAEEMLEVVIGTMTNLELS